MDKIGIGIDIGGTEIKAAKFNLISGKMLDQKMFPTKDGEVVDGEPAFVNSVRKLIDEFSKEAEPKLSNIGLSAPGLVQKNGRAIGYMPGRLQGIEGLDWTNLIDSNLTVHVINDACDVNEQRFTDRIAARLPQWPWKDSTIHSEHKADATFPIVGMASILAKVERDSRIEQISQDVGIPLGSGYPSDPNTKAALPNLLVDSEPHPALRWSWKTVTRAWNEKYGVDPPKRAYKDGQQKTLF